MKFKGYNRTVDQYVIVIIMVLGLITAMEKNYSHFLAISRQSAATYPET